MVSQATLIVGEGNAEDVVQDIFIYLLGSTFSSKINNPERFMYWLVKNRSIQFLRKKKVRLKHGEVQLREAIEDVNISITRKGVEPEQSDAETKKIEELYEILGWLEPFCRELYLLVNLDAKTIREISRETGIDYNRLRYIYKNIKNQINERTQ